jgi:hypothetical protein
MHRTCDPMDATRRAHRAQKRDLARQRMTSDMVEAGMRKVIREKLELCQPIELDDFRRANLPMDQVQDRFRGALAAVQNAMAMERA